MSTRDYDLILYGATGFTGRLAARYLATHSETAACRWAIAGRDTERLRAVQSELSATTGVAPALLNANSGDARSIARMAAATRLDAALFGEIVRQQLNLPTIVQTAEEKDAIKKAPGGFGPACDKHETLSHTASVYDVKIADNDSEYTMFQTMLNWLGDKSPQVLVDPDLDQTGCP